MKGGEEQDEREGGEGVQEGIGGVTRVTACYRIQE